MKFKNFSVSVVHDKCGEPARLVQEDNGACGDPECCGAYETWIEAHCDKCKQIERPS